MLSDPFWVFLRALKRISPEIDFGWLAFLNEAYYAGATRDLRRYNMGHRNLARHGLGRVLDEMCLIHVLRAKIGRFTYPLDCNWH